MHFGIQLLIALRDKGLALFLLGLFNGNACELRLQIITIMDARYDL